MPRAPKPKEMRQNTERRDIGDVPDPEDPESDAPPLPAAPRPLRSWLKATKDSWERYWRSPARFVTVESLDTDTLERLWNLYDERERAQRELRKARTVIGSTGQTRPSGFYTIIRALDAEIRQLEDRVGKHMKSRLTLGMVVGGADRNDDGDEPGIAAPERPDADETPPDPRLYVLDGRAG